MTWQDTFPRTSLLDVLIFELLFLSLRLSSLTWPTPPFLTPVQAKHGQAWQKLNKQSQLLVLAPGINFCPGILLQRCPRILSPSLLTARLVPLLFLLVYQQVKSLIRWAFAPLGRLLHFCPPQGVMNKAATYSITLPSHQYISRHRLLLAFHNTLYAILLSFPPWKSKSNGDNTDFFNIGHTHWKS